MPYSDSNADDARDREFIQLMQADVERMREESRASNKQSMLTLERSMCEKFRQLREERGWSQGELSERLAGFGVDMHQTTIAKMEAGKRPLRVSEMFGLSHAFGMPTGAVFFMPIRVEQFDGMEQLSAEIARTEEAVEEMRTRTMEMIGTFVDFAADYGVKRDHLITLMRETGEDRTHL